MGERGSETERDRKRDGREIDTDVREDEMEDGGRSLQTET